MTEPNAMILVIDDDPFARAFAEVVLSGAGYRVAQAATASEGLAMVAHTAPNLIVLDYAMPGMTGLDALQALRSGANAPEVSVIMLSAWVSNDVRQAVEALDAVWLAKPLAADGLSSAVRAALN
jgi:CheY-like chemotaxis protein